MKPTSSDADPPRRAGRPLRPIATRTLLDIAARVFAERGYDGASLSHIAAQAGLRKASLYHHFPTKEALYAAVIQQLVGDLQRLIGEADLATGDFASRLDRLGGLVIDTFAERPDSARLLVLEMVAGGRYMTGSGAADVQGTFALTAAFLGAGMAAGAFRTQDPRQLALTIASLHLYPFAAAEVAGTFLGRGFLEPETVAARKAAVLEHVRALCLAPG
jgi:TetR/AcrR family transcriptional regulator